MGEPEIRQLMENTKKDLAEKMQENDRLGLQFRSDARQRESRVAELSADLDRLKSSLDELVNMNGVSGLTDQEAAEEQRAIEAEVKEKTAQLETQSEDNKKQEDETLARINAVRAEIRRDEGRIRLHQRLLKRHEKKAQDAVQ